MPSHVIAVASNKGGVGKTTLAIELAYQLGAPLIDLDHDAGSATGGWTDVGVQAPELARRALLDGDGHLPRAVRRHNLPAFIPSHPAYGAAALDPEAVAGRISAWAEASEAPFLVVDTHPGFNALTVGAMAAAHWTVVPVVLARRELDALAGLLTEYAGYPIATVPNRVPRPRGNQSQSSLIPFYNRWVEITEAAGSPRGPAITEHRWWPRRMSRGAVTAVETPGAQLAEAQVELRLLADFVRDLCRG